MNVCFVVNIFFYMSCYLMFIDMFNIQIQLMQRLDNLNEYVRMQGHSVSGLNFHSIVLYCRWMQNTGRVSGCL